MNNNKLWQYKRVADLEIGEDILVNNNGVITPHTISHISKEIASRETDIFYRLNVETVDNYFANGILVHNSESNKPSEDKNAKKGKDRGNECSPESQGTSDANDCLDDKGCKKKGNDGKSLDDCDKKMSEMKKKLCDNVAKLKKAGETSTILPGINPRRRLMKNFGGMSNDKCKTDSALDTMWGEMQQAAKDYGCGGGGGGKDPGDCCIHANTEVLTPTGTTQVKNLKQGDAVLSYKLNGSNDDALWSLWNSNSFTGNLTQSVVVSNDFSSYYYYYTVTTNTGITLKVTYEHPVLVNSHSIPSIITII